MRQSLGMGLGLVMLFGLSGCADVVDTSEPLIVDSDAGTRPPPPRCEASWERPLRIATGERPTVGRVYFEMQSGYLYAFIRMHREWKLGDVYLGVGEHGHAPTWSVANPEPWITGWRYMMRIRHPIGPRTTCGDVIKIQLQVNVRRRDGRGGHWLASAYGPYDRGRWGWADYRPWCCDYEPDPCTNGFAEFCAPE